MIQEILGTYPHQWTHVTNKSIFKGPSLPPVYVLHLNTAPTRLKYMTAILQKLGISYHLLSVAPLPENIYKQMQVQRTTACTRAETGCALTHLFCLFHILHQTTHESFIVLEDDVIFHRDFHARFSETLNKNKHADMLMLGATDFYYKQNIQYDQLLNGTQLTGNTDPQAYTPKYNAFGAHAIYYTRPFAEAWVNHKLLNDKISVQFDQDFVRLYKLHLLKVTTSTAQSMCDKKNKHLFNVRVCHPSIVMADFSTSHLNHQTFRFSDRFMVKWFGLPSCITYSDYHMFYLDVLDKMWPAINEKSESKESVPIDYVAQITAAYPAHYAWILERIDLTLFELFDK